MDRPLAQHAAGSEESRLYRRKRVLLSLMMVAFVLAVFETGSYIVLIVIRPYLDREIRRTASIYAEQSHLIRQLLLADTTGRDAFDPVLGWHYRSNYTAVDEHINSHGMRGNREYSLRRPDGVLRVAAFGDSFVYGMEVGYKASWPWFLEQSDEQIEVLNYGVGGYGTDQELLRYRAEGSSYSPQVVLIGFAPINLGRNVNRYRRFLSTREGVWVKPRFIVEHGALVLLPSPVLSLDDWRPFLDQPEDVRAFGVHDQWYEPMVYENPLYDFSATARLLTNVYLRLRYRYFDSDRMVAGGAFNTAAPAFEVTAALLLEFAAAVRAVGARPIILILPNREDVRASRAGEATVSSTLIEALDGEEVWDLAEAFATAPSGVNQETWFMPYGHYSAAGNYLVASWLGDRLIEEYADADSARSVAGGTR